MAIHAELDTGAGIWRVSTEGTLSLDEIGELIETNPWRDHRLVLWDLRNLREAPRSTRELREAASLVASARRLFEGGRAAIVVSADLDFGMARMFEAFAEGSGVAYRTFRDIESAQAWLLESDRPLD